MKSARFQVKLFVTPKEYEETPVRDRKALLPTLQRANNPKRFLKEKAEFIRDVVALANTARLFGQPAYLLYGIDDDGNLVGVERSMVDHCDFEQVRHDMGNVIREYVEPALPCFNFRCGEVKGKRCAYLIIHPMPSRKPFRVRKKFPSRGEALVREGDCWIRFGESKRDIEHRHISEAPYSYSYAQIPYILPSKWLKYFNSILADETISRAKRIPAYQNLAVGNSLLSEAVAGFLESTQEALLVITGGAGSGKSTFLHRLAYNWAEAGQIEMKMVRHREEFKPPSGWIPIHLPLRNAEVPDTTAFTRILLDRVNQEADLWIQRPDNPEHLLEYPDLHWLLCLDGLDELWQIERKHAVFRILRDFGRRYPRIRTVLTTRPSITIPSDIQRLEIAPLSRNQVLDYVSNYASEEAYQEFLSLLDAEPGLWELCNTPIYLEAATAVVADTHLPSTEAQTLVGDGSYFSHTIRRVERVEWLAANGTPQQTSDVNELPRIKEEEIIWTQPLTTEPMSDEEDSPSVSVPIEMSPGKILDRMFEHLWARELERRPLRLTEVETWRYMTGRLAIKMDGHCPAARKQKVLSYLGGSGIEESSEELLRWVLNLGILRNYQGWFSFATYLTKVFFAAAFLKPFVEYEAYDEARLYLDDCEAEFRERVRDFLRQIIYGGVDQLFTEVNYEC